MVRRGRQHGRNDLLTAAAGEAAKASTRLGGLVLLAVLLAHLRFDGRPATLCTLRALTGVPCPFCGGTTAAVHAGSGDLLGAVRASPLTALGAPVVAALPVIRKQVCWVRSRLPAAGVTALVAVLAASELWQLHRFGWI